VGNANPAEVQKM